MRVENLRAKPWKNFAAPPEVHLPKGMLGAEERTCFYWLGRFWLSGAGCVVDAGAFIGASAYCFASGARDGGKQSFKGGRLVHSYDYFEVIDEYVGQSISKEIRPINLGDPYLEIFKSQTAPYERMIQTYAGDFLTKKWNGLPIEILFIDVAKTQNLNSHCCAQFFPQLIPGRSVVIQQDYYHCWHPYIHVSMEFFSDEFELIDERVPFQSRVWLLTKPLSREKIARISKYDLSASERIGLIDRLIEKSSPESRAMLEVVRVWQLCLDKNISLAQTYIEEIRKNHDVDQINDLWARQLREIETVSIRKLSGNIGRQSGQSPVRGYIDSGSVQQPQADLSYFENVPEKVEFVVSGIRPGTWPLFPGCTVRNPHGTGFGGGGIKVKFAEASPGMLLTIRAIDDIMLDGSDVYVGNRLVGRVLEAPKDQSCIEVSFVEGVYFELASKIVGSLALTCGPVRKTQSSTILVSVTDADGDVTDTSVQVSVQGRR